MLTNHSKTGSLCSDLTFFFWFLYGHCVRGLTQQSEGTTTVGASSPWPGYTPNQGFNGLEELPSNEISFHMRNMGDKRRHITNYGRLQWETLLRN